MCRPNKLTKSEARLEGANLLDSLGVNTAEHLQRAMNPITFKQRVDWCRINRTAWTEGKTGPVITMESQLSKHILPRFGDLPLHMVDETAVQGFITHLKRTTFEMRKPNGDIMKTYKLSRKTILNIVGVVKLVLEKKVWRDWELDLGKPENKAARYFTEEQLQRIIAASEGQNRVLFALLAGTGMRIGEAAGLHVDDLDLNNCVITVRRAVWGGVEQSPKTENSMRVIDIDLGLAEMLRQHLGEKRVGRVFASQSGSPISGNNILKRVLHPLLAKLEIPSRAGLHAFRHSRVTMLRKRGTPEDLLELWIGHAPKQTATTDRYSHTDQELEYRRLAASRAGLSITVGPNGPKTEVGNFSASA